MMANHTHVLETLSLVPWKSRNQRGIPTFPQPRLLLSTFSDRIKPKTGARKSVNYVPGLKCQTCLRPYKGLNSFFFATILGGWKVEIYFGISFLERTP